MTCEPVIKGKVPVRRVNLGEWGESLKKSGENLVTSKQQKQQQLFHINYFQVYLVQTMLKHQMI